MVNLTLVLITSILMYFYFYIIGDAILCAFKQKFRHYFSPIIGYTVFSYVFFIWLHIATDFYSVLSVFLLFLIGGIFLRKVHKPSLPRFPYLTLVLSFIISLNLVYLLYPKLFGDSLVLEPPVFDHMKTAFTASITQFGIPVNNPFCAFPEKTYYYFLYYVPLSVIKIVFQTTAYEAELSGEILSCLLGIPVILGCVCLLRDKECSWKEVAICSLFILMSKKYDQFLYFPDYHGIDSILRTILWTPNTFLATSLMIFSLFWLYIHKLSYSYVPAFLLSVALGMSPYIFVVAFVGLGSFFLFDFYTASEKKKLFIRWMQFGGITFLFSAPFLWIQMHAKGAHQFPIAIEVYDFAPDLDPFLKIGGFWTFFLILQIPIIILLNIAFLKSFGKKYGIFYFFVFVALMISCFFKSTIDNNDLGWRSSFVAVEILTIFAIYYFERIKNNLLKLTVVLGCMSFISFPYFGEDQWKYILSLSQETISAIQNYVSEDDYFLNNIDNDGPLTPWISGNVGYAILSERKSCYMSVPAIRAYCQKSLRNYGDLIPRIFNETFSKEDIDAVKSLKCNKFIFQKTDPNYNKDEFLSSFGLRKIYENDQIKIWE